MPTPVRPQFPPVQLPRAPRTGEAARSAQRAFFDAALGKPQASATAPKVETPRPVQSAPIAAPPEDAPSGRILRPGSYVDIKV